MMLSANADYDHGKQEEKLAHGCYFHSYVWLFLLLSLKIAQYIVVFVIWMVRPIGLSM